MNYWICSIARYNQLESNDEKNNNGFIVFLDVQMYSSEKQPFSADISKIKTALLKMPGSLQQQEYFTLNISI